MHWTDLIARRYRFPPDARVITDLPCAGCGYNLRNARVGGRCPECGADVAGSLVLIPRPMELADALAGAAKSYVCLVLLFLGCCLLVPGGPATMLLTVAVVLLGTGVFRAIAVGVMRFRSRLHLHPAHGGPVRLAWGLIFVELGVGVATSAAFTLAVSLSPGAARSAAEAVWLPLAALWIIAIVALMLVLARLGAGIAGEFGYEDVRRRFAGTFIAVAASPLVIALGTLLLVSGTGPAGGLPLGLALVASSLVPMTIAGGLAFDGLLRVAQIVRTERLDHEDAVDTAPQVVTPQHRPTPDRPDIPIE